MSRFDLLDPESHEMLISFLKNRGSLKGVQAELGISYPTAKKRLDDLLAALDLADSKEKQERVELDMLDVDYNSHLASEMIKAKLKDNGGKVTVYTQRGLPCEIYAGADGKTFKSDKLPISPSYEYSVFDDIVGLLLSQGGHARKGNGRNNKLGDAGCEENTVVGVVAKSRGRKAGDSVFDPVFVLAAVLEWAGIAENGRGELTLTEEYMSKL